MSETQIEPYGTLLSTFFSGATGMSLQAQGTAGKDAMLLGLFLTANEWSNMIGLYELSPAKLGRRLPCVKGRALEKAWALLASEHFAYFDPETEMVWVREMARVRLRITPGEVVSNPRKRVAAQNCYQRAPLNPFLGPFFDRYRIELGLKHRRGDGTAPTQRQVPEQAAPTLPLAPESDGDPAPASGDRITGANPSLIATDRRLQVLRDAVFGASEPERADASTFHRVIESRLVAAGLSVQREVEVPWLDGAAGRIDLVIAGDPAIAVELDNRTGRAKSLTKLLMHRGIRVLVLRNGYETPAPTSGIEIVFSCPPLPPPDTEPRFDEPLSEPLGEPFTEPFGERSVNERQVPVRTTSEIKYQVPVQQEAEIQRTPSAAPRLVRPAVGDPSKNVAVIARLIREQVLPIGLPEAELLEAAKAACARQRIAYDSTVVKNAIDSAMAQDRKGVA